MQKRESPKNHPSEHGPSTLLIIMLELNEGEDGERETEHMLNALSDSFLFGCPSLQLAVELPRKDSFMFY